MTKKKEKKVWAKLQSPRNSMGVNNWAYIEIELDKRPRAVKESGKSPRKRNPHIIEGFTCVCQPEIVGQTGFRRKERKKKEGRSVWGVVFILFK